MSPCGTTFNQQKARELLKQENIILVCGHYEGIDQRFIDECVDEEISLGDFVLTGGEIPAMAVADCICRMVPGVLSDPECFEDESHWNGLLEYPSIPGPRCGTAYLLPKVLLSGHHGNVARWRRKQSILRTRQRLAGSVRTAGFVLQGGPETPSGAGRRNRGTVTTVPRFCLLISVLPRPGRRCRPFRPVCDRRCGWGRK